MSPDRSEESAPACRLPRLLADACVAAPVVAWLRERGADVESIQERALAHWTDAEILALALEEERFVLTHDSDFGALAFQFAAPIHGVLIIRPGDEPPEATVAPLRPLVHAQVDWSPPMVAVFRDGRLRIRRMDDERG